MSSAGGGMSFFIKKEIIDKLLKNKKVVILDSDGEYPRIRPLKITV